MKSVENTNPIRQLPVDIPENLLAYKEKRQNIEWLEEKLEMLNQDKANNELFKIAYQLAIRMNPRNKDFVREKLKEIVLSEIQAAEYD